MNDNNQCLSSRYFKYKNIDFGFVILCPEKNLNGLKSTAKTIKYFHNRPVLAVVPKETTKEELKSFNEFCPTHKGGNTITSLINKGIDTIETPWATTIMAGVSVRARTCKKYHYFLENENDILFQVLDRKYSFDECSLNGLMISKKAFKDVGSFDEKESLEECKLLWALEAIQKGYKFKAIVGAKIL